MRSPSSLGPVVLVLYFFCSAALGYRLPVDEVFKNELQKKQLQLRDQICVENDVLLSFQEYSEDSVPFCSAYLGIGISTSIVPVTGRTTVTTTTTVTTGETVNAIVVPTGTVTVTTSAGLVDRRQFVTPASIFIAACTLSPQNQSLISTVSSACSCLTITPSVLDQTATVTSTRTLTAIDYIEQTISGTAFSRITTTVTVLPLPMNATTVSALSGTAPMSTSIPLSSSNAATIASPSNSAVPQSIFPISSASSASPTTLRTAVSSGPPVASINATTPVSSNPSTPSTTTIPLVVLTSVPRSAPTISSSPSVVPIGFTNSTTPTSGVSSGISTGPLDSSSGIPIGPSNITTPTSTSTMSSTSSLPSLGGLCPFENGTYYTTHGQTFLIYCYINFPGPSNHGLDEPDLYACINACATVNLGFSQDNCWAASYFPNTLDNQNCFFRNKQDSELPFTDYLTISAELISGLPNGTTNATSSVGPPLSPSGSISIPQTVNITSIPFAGTSVTIGASSAPSRTPTISANSSFPTVPPSGGLPTISASSRLLTISANSSFPTAPPFSGFPTVPASSGLPILTSANITFSPSVSSGFPTISSNVTGPHNRTSLVTIAFTSIFTTTITETSMYDSVITDIIEDRIVATSPPTSAPLLKK